MQQPPKKGFMGQGMQSALFGQPVGAHRTADRVLPELAHHAVHKRVLGAKVMFMGNEHNDIGNFIDAQPDDGIAHRFYLLKPLVKGRIGHTEHFGCQGLITDNQFFNQADIGLLFGDFLLNAQGGGVKHRQPGIA